MSIKVSRSILGQVERIIVNDLPLERMDGECFRASVDDISHLAWSELPEGATIFVTTDFDDDLESLENSFTMQISGGHDSIRVEMRAYVDNYVGFLAWDTVVKALAHAAERAACGSSKFADCDTVEDPESTTLILSFKVVDLQRQCGEVLRELAQALLNIWLKIEATETDAERLLQQRGLW